MSGCQSFSSRMQILSAVEHRYLSLFGHFWNLPGIAGRGGTRERRNHEYVRRSHGVTNATPQSGARSGMITLPLSNTVNAPTRHAV